MQVERCQFLSKEQAERVEDRVSIAININSNDAKIRDNRVVKFRHFMLAAGTGYLISGNHFFQGDDVPNGVRSAGLIFTGINIRSTVNGNYIDNCSIEWINEHDPAPEQSSELSFGALTINDNIFMLIRSAPWFSFLVIRPPARAIISTPSQSVITRLSISKARRLSVLMPWIAVSRRWMAAAPRIS